MIHGRVSASLAAIVGLEMLAAGGRQQIEAVVDTGFNGALSLPPEAIDNLGLARIGVSEGTLADGSVTEFETYLGTVVWHGANKVVVIVESPGGSLLGMSLLRESRLKIDVLQQGEVLIQPLNALDAS